jgi:hypothetical protein
MDLELRPAARYLLVDRTVVAEHAGLGWWLLHAAGSASGVQLTWAIAPDGRIYQGSIEVAQDTNPATFHPLGPVTDLTTGDLTFVADGPYGDEGMDQTRRRTLT